MAPRTGDETGMTGRGCRVDLRGRARSRAKAQHARGRRSASRLRSPRAERVRVAAPPLLLEASVAVIAPALEAVHEVFRLDPGEAALLGAADHDGAARPAVEHRP